MRFLDAEGISERLTFHGIDNSERRLANIFDSSRWQLTLGDITHGLPYPADQFDVCLCEQVLEHLPRPSDTLAEIARLLRPGGLAVLGVPVFPPGVAHTRALFAWFMERTRGVTRPHLQSFTCRSFVALVSAAHPSFDVRSCRGFRIVSGGPLSRLEDYAWWYRFNRCIGHALPWFCSEVQLVVRKGHAR
jgi:SAM-dependent methyltransferase